MTQPAPTREEVLAALHQERPAQVRPGQGKVVITSEDLSRGITPPMPYEPPLSGAQTERGETGPELIAKAAPGDAVGGLTTVGGGGAYPGGFVVPKNPGRSVLNAVSGGATEAVGEAVKSADKNAAEQVQAKQLSGMSPAALAALLAQADPSQQSVTLVRTPGGWVPGTRTEAKGETGKDPRAVREAGKLQDEIEIRSELGATDRQAAERSQYDRIQRVQQNEMQATQEFKRQNDELDDRYNRERQVQLEKMQGIQKAMEQVPNAPRTIAQKLAASGTEDKIRFGLAAAFSIIGGAAMRDGGKSAQTLLDTMQANIDREVKKEQEQYARQGDLFKVSDNIYAHLRQNMGDDRAALNVTKALYYDAMMNAVEQIGTQYKLDMQAPQMMKLMEDLVRERQKLVLDTASTLQDQFSQTDKYRPPGVAAVGGGAARKGDPEHLTKQLKEYHDAFEKKGGNSATRALALYQKAIESMKAHGYANDEKFWSVFAAMNSADSPKAQAAILSDANLDPEQRKAMQLIIDAGAEQLKDESGKAVTANELARDIMKKGGYSITSLDTVRDSIAKKRENIYASTDAGFGGGFYMGQDGKLHNEVGDVYRSRQDLSELRRENPGIGTTAPEPIDPSDIEQRVEARMK